MGWVLIGGVRGHYRKNKVHDGALEGGGRVAVLDFTRHQKV